MTLDQLNYLLVLAEEQNITRAAQKLFITQPTLTTFVTKLERELGTKLFDRSRNPITLTKNGELYIKKMQELLLAEQQLKDELRYQNSGRRRLRIGIGYAHSAMWSSQLAKALLAEFPEMDIRFCEGQEARLMKSLRAGEIDLFFGHAEMDPVSFVVGELLTEKMILLLPSVFLEETDLPAINTPDQPLLITPETIIGRRMIVPGSSMGSNLNVQLLWKTFGFNPPNVIQTNNTITGIQMVAQGLGYMMGNDELVRFLQPDMQANVKYCTLPNMFQTRKYYYCYAENAPDLDLILKAIEHMQQITAANFQPLAD